MDNRQALRQATRAVHEATENTWFSTGTFGSLARYRHWLQAMRLVHRDLGRPSAIMLRLEDLITLEEARQVALDADLGDRLGQGADEARAADDSWAWGVQYALNGSALGASMILRSDEIRADWPVAYLTCMKRFASDGHLRPFFDKLNARDLDQTRCRDGATAVFARLSAYAEA